MNIKKYIPILTIIISFALLGGIAGNIIFADDDVPEILLGGKKENIEPIFTQDMEPWYPGYYTTKTLKIKNDLDVDAVLKNVGMNIRFKRDNEVLDLNNIDAQDYMKNMEIKIGYKNPFKNMVKGTIYEGNFKGFVSGVDISIPIEKNSDLNLEYTIGMKKEAESNVADIEGIIDFTFNIQQNAENKDDDGDSIKNSYGGEEYVTIQEEEVPLDIVDHWAHDCIETLMERGIIVGYEDGTIRPENNITRAETAVLVARALGIEESEVENLIYKDYLPRWAKGHILALTERGVLEGYDNGEFRPDQYITREEMAKVLVVAFRKKLENGTELKFLDRDEIGKWAVDYVRAGVENKVIEGYPNNTFKPKQSITRAETFTMICKLLGLHETH